MTTVSFNQKFILGLGFIGFFFSIQGLSILAVPFYQMTLGVDPFLLGLAMKLPVFVAACLGPWVGRISDRCQSQLGRRRPFLLFFPWVSALLFGFIWMVPNSWTPTEQLIYFASLAAMFYIVNIFWTLPLKCLAYEASTDTHERTKIMGFMTYFFKFSSLFYHWLFPLAQLSIFGGILIGIQYVGWFVGIIFIGLLACLPGLFVKEKVYKRNKFKLDPSLLVSLRAIFSNPNMRIIVALLILQMSFGVFSATSDYYVLVYYVNQGDVALGAQWKGILSTGYAISGFFAIALITKFSEKFGKITTLKLIYTLTIFGGIMKWFLYVPNIGWWLILDPILCVSMWVGIGVIISSIVADLIAEDETHNNTKRGGIFVATQNWVIQIASSIAVITFGLTLNLINFDSQLGGEQPKIVIDSLRFILSGGTVFAAAVSLYVVHFFRADDTGQIMSPNMIKN